MLLEEILMILSFAGLLFCFLVFPNDIAVAVP